MLNAIAYRVERDVNREKVRFRVPKSRFVSPPPLFGDDIMAGRVVCSYSLKFTINVSFAS